MLKSVSTPVVVRRIGVLVRRTSACLAAGSAGLHAWAAADHPPATAASSVLLAAMVIGCFYCAWHLWRRGVVRDWAVVAVMSAAMLVLHSATGDSAIGHKGHHSALSVTSHAESMSPVMGAATVTAFAELLIAFVVVFRATRRTEMPQ